MQHRRPWIFWLLALCVVSLGAVPAAVRASATHSAVRKFKGNACNYRSALWGMTQRTADLATAYQRAINRDYGGGYPFQSSRNYHPPTGTAIKDMQHILGALTGTGGLEWQLARLEKSYGINRVQTLNTYNRPLVTLRVSMEYLALAAQGEEHEVGTGIDIMSDFAMELGNTWPLMKQIPCGSMPAPTPKPTVKTVKPRKTATPTETPTETPTPTSVPTATITPTLPPRPTVTPVVTRTATATSTPVLSPTATLVTPLSLQNASLYGGIDANGPTGAPQSSFPPTQATIYVWATFATWPGKHTITYNWFTPDNKLYLTYSDTGQDRYPSVSDDALQVAGQPPANITGQWNLQILVDGIQEASIAFSITNGTPGPTLTPTATLIGGTLAGANTPTVVPTATGTASGSSDLSLPDSLTLHASADPNSASQTTFTYPQTPDVYAFASWPDWEGDHDVTFVWFDSTGTPYDQSDDQSTHNGPVTDTSVLHLNDDAANLPGEWTLSVSADGLPVDAVNFCLVTPNQVDGTAPC